MLTFVGDSLTPVLPVWYDVAFSTVPVLLLAAMIMGLVSIIRRHRTMSGLECLGWSAFVVFAPVLGAIVWFAAGRQHYSVSSTVSGGAASGEHQSYEAAHGRHS